VSNLRWRALAAASAAAVIALAACSNGNSEDSPAPTSPTGTVTAHPTPANTRTAAPTDTASDANGLPSVTQPPSVTGPPAESVTLLSPVDKDHALPADYVPPGLAAVPASYLAPGFGGELRQEAVDALTRMLDDASAAGHDIRARSAYRSYAEQETTFNYWVGQLGFDQAVRVSAMPGHSEHQLGTTADLSSPEVGWDLVESFGETAPGKWLAANAHDYGFALSYPDGKEDVTGYSYEPWHFRYIGTAEAQAWKASGLTLNQYLLQ
jgi:D-alanyl-D-alanine carboxypeptidase